MPKPYKKPDLNKPRKRRDAKRVLNTAFYKKFHKENPDTGLVNMDIKKIIITFHELCTDVIANTRDGLEFPEQLGYIFLGSCKPKDAAADPIKSQEVGQEVLTPNWNSNGWLCKISYTNFANKYKFKNFNFWGFEASRPLKRKVSKAYSKDYKKYVILDDYRLSYIFKAANKRLRNKLREQKNLE